MNCTCGRVMLGSEDSGTRNWNPDCLQHGVGTPWYEHPARAAKRAAERQRTIDLQLQARQARRDARTHTPEWHEDPAHIYHPVDNPSGCDKFFCMERFGS